MPSSKWMKKIRKVKDNFFEFNEEQTQGTQNLNRTKAQKIQDATQKEEENITKKAVNDHTSNPPYLISHSNAINNAKWSSSTIDILAMIDRIMPKIGCAERVSSRIGHEEWGEV